MNSWPPKITSDFNLKKITMITFMDENGIRTFKYNDSENLMASWVKTRIDINFVLVDGQGTFIGAGSNGQALMKSMLLIKETQSNQSFNENPAYG
jgi:hypothetical protein